MVRLGVLGLVIWLGVAPALASAGSSPEEEAFRFAKAGDLERALKTLTGSPTPSAEAYLRLVVVLAKRQEYALGATVAAKGQAAFPDHTGLMNVAGLLAFRLGQWEEAERLWRRVLAVKPGDSFAASWLRKLQPGQPPAASESADSEMLEAAKNLTEKADQKASPSPAPFAQRSAYAISEPRLPRDEQEKLAKNLFEEMSTLKLWDLDAFERLHREVIVRCPDTPHAQLSCWKLANLFLTGRDQPDFPAIIAVLETLMERYPSSPLANQAIPRLVRAYEETKQPSRIKDLLAARLADSSLSDQEFISLALPYAKALSALGEAEEAATVFRQIIDRDGGRGSYAVEVARRALGE